VGKPEGKTPLGRPRHRWVDNIIMHLTEVGWGGLDWVDLAQDRGQWRAIVNITLKSSGSIKCWEIHECLSNWVLLKKGSAPWN
jgi:hypothetical protein